MRDYCLVTDSSWDMSDKYKEEYQIKVVPFSFCLDGEHYLKEDIDISVDEVYRYLIEHPEAVPRSAQPSVEDYVKAFEEAAEEGKDVLCFTLSSKLTGSVNSARLAAEFVKDDHPEMEILVKDTLLATIAQGAAILEIARYKESGATLKEAFDKAEEIFPDARIFFTVENLDYLIKGGRVGKAIGAGANALSARPLILLKEGELFSDGLAVGRKRSIRFATRRLADYISSEKININDYSFYVAYGADPEESEGIRDMICEILKENGASDSVHVEVARVGGLIACYTGPYPIGAVLVRKA